VRRHLSNFCQIQLMFLALSIRALLMMMCFADPGLALVYKVQDGHPQLFLQMCNFLHEGLEVVPEGAVLMRGCGAFLLGCTSHTGCLCAVDTIDLLVGRWGCKCGHHSYTDTFVSENLLSCVLLIDVILPFIAAVTLGRRSPCDSVWCSGFSGFALM